MTLDERTTAQPAFPNASRAALYDESIALAAEQPAPPTEVAEFAATAESRASSADPLLELRRASGQHKAAPSRPHGIRRALGAVGIKVRPSAETLRAAEQNQIHRDSERIVRQATWTRAVSILVANPKGGVGKTPTAIILGGTIAAIRGGSVCIMEVSDDAGALTFRSEGDPTLGIGELVADAEKVDSAGHLAGYTAPQTSFASVLGSVGPRASLRAEDIAAVTSLIDKYYSVRVMDSGNQTSSSAFRGALESADVLVVPVLNAPDAILEASSLLRTLRSMEGKASVLAKRALVLRLSDGRPENSELQELLDHVIDDSGFADEFEIPCDPHIAERGPITLDLLAPATRAAFTEAAASVVSSLQSTVR